MTLSILFQNAPGIFTIAAQDPDMLALWRALVILYENAGQPEKSLEILIGLKESSVFILLRRYMLAEDLSGGRFGVVVRKYLIPLCQIDNVNAVSLMIDCMRELPVCYI